MKTVLHVWSRIKCKWVLWHGSYAAWKALPHAVAICCCAAVAVTAVRHFAAEGLPRFPAPARLTVPETPPSPAAIRLATLGIIPYDPRYNSLTQSAIQPQEIGGVSSGPSCASCAGAPMFLPPPFLQPAPFLQPPPVAVREPGSLSLFAGGVLALTLAALARRRRHVSE